MAASVGVVTFADDLLTMVGPAIREAGPRYAHAMAESINLGDLEDVEILQEVERVFGISITDREAEQTFTVGQLCDLLDAKYGGGATEVCLSQIAFHRLRRALRELGVADRSCPPRRFR